MGVAESLLVGVGLALILLGNKLWPVVDENLFEFLDVEP